MKSKYSKSTCLALAIIGNIIFIGGLHRFYSGRYFSGFLMLITLGGVFVWTLIDVVLLLTNGYLDSRGMPVKDWDI
tara:strand:- start:381 stop:608 length:228 start_codon:yes stop_codon:yes gene_type:complete